MTVETADQQTWGKHQVGIVTHCVICHSPISETRIRRRAVTCCQLHSDEWRLIAKKMKRSEATEEANKDRACKKCGDPFTAKTANATTCPKCMKGIRREYNNANPVNIEKAHLREEPLFTNRASLPHTSSFLEHRPDLIHHYSNIKIEYVDKLEGESSFKKEIDAFLEKGNQIRRLPPSKEVPYIDDLLSRDNDFSSESFQESLLQKETQGSETKSHLSKLLGRTVR